MPSSSLLVKTWSSAKELTLLRYSKSSFSAASKSQSPVRLASYRKGPFVRGIYKGPHYLSTTTYKELSSALIGRSSSSRSVSSLGCCDKGGSAQYRPNSTLASSRHPKSLGSLSSCQAICLAVDPVSCLAMQCSSDARVSGSVKLPDDPSDSGDQAPCALATDASGQLPPPSSPAAKPDGHVSPTAESSRNGKKTSFESPSHDVEAGAGESSTSRLSASDVGLPKGTDVFSQANDYAISADGCIPGGAQDLVKAPAPGPAAAKIGAMESTSTTSLTKFNDYDPLRFAQSLDCAGPFSACSVREIKDDGSVASSLTVEVTGSRLLCRASAAAGDSSASGGDQEVFVVLDALHPSVTAHSDVLSCLKSRIENAVTDDEATIDLHRGVLVPPAEADKSSSSSPAVDPVAFKRFKAAAPYLEHPGGVVLSVSSPSGATPLLDIVVGKLRCRDMLACARNKLWWMTPEWSSAKPGSKFPSLGSERPGCTQTLPPETQFLLGRLWANADVAGYEDASTSDASSRGRDAVGGGAGKKPAGGRSNGDSPYVIVLPLIDGDFRGTIRPPKVDKSSSSSQVDSDLLLRLESGSEAVAAARWEAALYVGVGWDPYALVDRGVAAAAALSGGALPRVSKTLPASLEGFGWCTWDAFYSTVSAAGIRQGLRQMRAAGVRPRTLIIDDGWQVTDLDPEFRKGPTAELAEALHVSEASRALVEETQSEMVAASREVIADTASLLMPSSTSAGTAVATLANIGPLPPPPLHASHAAGHQGSTDAALSSMGSNPASVSHPVTGGKGDSGAEATAKASAPPAGGAESKVVQTSTTEKDQSALTGQKREQVLWIVRLGQRVLGWLMGIFTAAFLIFYQAVVEPAAADSLAVKLFGKAARGLLRDLMLGFYATASDFSRRLSSVRANGKFSSLEAGPDADWDLPEALGPIVGALKREFQIQHVYCWHGMPGYWGGASADSSEMAEEVGVDVQILKAQPTPGVMEIEPSMAWNPAVLGGIGVVSSPSRLYNSMHSYLASCGVDGVKVDCQAGVGLVGSALGGGAGLSAHFQAALEASVAAHFPGNHCINCMCHSTENIYRMTRTAIARASDDFYPRDAPSSHPHIAACAFNSLFLSALVQPDWDMFQSRHVAAEIHATARVISGGGLYVSDKPGEHDATLLAALALPDGGVLRPRLPGRPTRDCLVKDCLRDGKTVLKVWNVNAISGAVALFHLQGSEWSRRLRKFRVHDRAPPPLQVQVRPSDVDSYRGAPEDALFAVYRRGGQTGRPHMLTESSSTSSPSGTVSGPVRERTADNGNNKTNAAGGERFRWSGKTKSGAESGVSAATPAFALLRREEAMSVTLAPGGSDMVVVCPVAALAARTAGNDAGAPPIAFAPLGLANMINMGGAVLEWREVAAAAESAEKLRGWVVTVRGRGNLVLYCSQRPSTVRSRFEFATDSTNSDSSPKSGPVAAAAEPVVEELSFTWLPSPSDIDGGLALVDIDLNSELDASEIANGDSTAYTIEDVSLQREVAVLF